MNSLTSLNLTHSFFELGPDYYQEKLPDPVSCPYLVDFNPDGSRLIGLATEESQKEEFVHYFSGNRSLPGAKPLAMVYSGHQFGAYNPQLGDGRGLLLGEVQAESGKSWDIYLKGCGPTRYARGFDGRATLRSSIREYLGQEAVHGLGIPTTRSLALVGIGELIYREFPEPAAVLVRLSDSHIRFGNFQYFHFINRPAQTTRLADYVVRRHYPELQNEANKHQLLFRKIIENTARLIASWQAVGFIHGVMNTDNMTITGVTFDYGPFCFMDRFNPNFTSNHSDAQGRYAFGRQPEIGYWNLAQLGTAFNHLIPPESLKQELAQYQPIYNSVYRNLIGRKLGLHVLDSEFNALVEKMFQILYENQVDYTLFFRSLSDFPSETIFRHGFQNQTALDRWLVSYLALIEREDLYPEERKKEMDRINPRFILRNYLMQRAIDKVLKNSDFSEIQRLRILLENPYNERPEVFERLGIDPEFYALETPKSFIEMQLSCSA